MGKTIGVDDLNGETTFALSIKDDDQTFVAPVELTQLKTPPVETTPVPSIGPDFANTGIAIIGDALDAVTVARVPGTPGEWLTCVTDRRQS